MINLITGTPGAGKTYLSIKLITDKYYYWHKKDKSFYRKAEAKKYTIITNINGLKLDHKDLTEIMQDVPFDTFFSFTYQEKIHKKYPHIIYVIDEIHDYMPPNYKNLEVIKYFSKHRHFGDKVWIITQDYSMIPRALNKLCELEYRAVKSTFTLLGQFIYNIKSNGEIYKRIKAKKDKRIFQQYKSFTGDDQEKQSNPLKIIIAILIIAFPVLVYTFYDMITPSEARQEAIKKPPEQKTIFKNEPKKNQNLFAIGDIPEPVMDLSKLRSIRIYSNVVVKNQLFAFQCPLTGIWYYNYERPYIVKKVENNYYAILTLRQYYEITQEREILTSAKKT